MQLVKEGVLKELVSQNPASSSDRPDLPEKYKYEFELKKFEYQREHEEREPEEREREEREPEEREREEGHHQREFE